VICIFPEGRITDNGELYPFRPGITRIIQRTPVPVVPMALRGLWESYFSRHSGRAMSGLPRRLSLDVALAAAPPLAPQEVTAEGLQQTVLALRGEWK
jgi:1-acyl-sn-glycerol-3-phosphate acyltransferase